ncbi:LysR family transcriptional regulator [Sphingobium sp. SYK-6]|uniref:LysR substrate-binding domain-containing protein n=1 Tax=Sphingobium sp. (strain NBRC 103272 / SYK-6) TaxID=627192 RepID=UPI000227711D|nr:LysR substrate-binding domain-containing protein [Sphingobium sp. SYK-6]BAK66380.1 LysR family transcriptional regulator [Sphingobium sp. SYK-6]
MTLTQLRSFIAVARYNGFTAAARALRTSQTTITSQIQALEEEHGARLFERRGRRIDLTPVGTEFLQIARQMIELENDAAILLKDSGALRQGAIKIGAVSPFHVIAMIEAFHSQYPDIYTSMRLGNSGDVLTDLGNYAADVGVVARADDDDRYYMQHYASYPVTAFVHRDHRLAANGSIELAELSKERLLMRETGSTTRRALEDAMASIGRKPRIAMEIGSREAIREAVIRGLGIGTVSQSEYVPDERLVPLPITGTAVVTHIYLCCLRERRRSLLISAFLNAVTRRTT